MKQNVTHKTFEYENHEEKTPKNSIAHIFKYPSYQVTAKSAQLLFASTYWGFLFHCLSLYKENVFEIKLHIQTYLTPMLVIPWKII